jgi:hypothetical protein
LHHIHLFSVQVTMHFLSIDWFSCDSVRVAAIVKMQHLSHLAYWSYGMCDAYVYRYHMTV